MAIEEIPIAAQLTRRLVRAIATRDILILTLECAVLLRIAQLKEIRSIEGRLQTIEQWRVEAVDAIASRGDSLMFPTRPHKGEGGTADTFNCLAKGLAALAFQPGGVSFMGCYWEASL